MKKKLFTLLLSIMALGASAQSWIDVTDLYIKNPRYDGNNYNYWQGTTLGSASPHENAEHYQKDFNTYQELSGLPVGSYRLSLSAFYRAGSSSDDYRAYTSGNYSDVQNAQLYAMSSTDYYSTPIALASSAALTNSLGGATSYVGGSGSRWSNDGYYIPNNMDAAYYWFEAGYYTNQLECKVNDDGKLTIGISKNTTIYQDWTCLDNWKLEYYGTLVNARSITLSQRTASLVLGEELQLTAIIYPSNTTFKQVEWRTEDEGVATVSAKGIVKAVGLGSTRIVATSSDGHATSYCTITVEDNPATAGSIIINEIQASNVDMFIDPSFNYGGWIELYNPTSKAVSLAGCYFSDETENLRKYKLCNTVGAVPAHGYLCLWFDHSDRFAPTQINTKLDCDGGMVLIVNSDGEILAQQTYPAAVTRTSYARMNVDSDVWGVTGSPTPGKSNVGSSFATTRLDAPEVDQDGQFFEGTLHVCVNIPEGATLRYTTDGSTPTLTNGETSETGLFQVDYTTVYRFRLFQEGMLPSQVVTRSYLYRDRNIDLPVISIVADENDLYSDSLGIFVQGVNGHSGNGQSSPCNWNMDWDRPANFEYITLDGQMVVSQELDITAAGGWSRAWTPHSFKLKASKQYEGLNYIPYQFFPNKPYAKHKTLQIRNGGNDTGSRVKDPALQEVIRTSGIDIDCQSYQPTVHYINGQYIGVINMREPNNKHFAQTNWGIDTDLMDQFEMSPDSGYVQKAGDKEAFNRWYELSYSAADDEIYEEICNTCVDIDEYINYMAMEFYLGGTDWPQNNVKGYRPRTENGKFRFVCFDLDGTFATTSPFITFANKQNYTFDYIYDIDGIDPTDLWDNRYHREIEFVTIFLNMLHNEHFAKQFVDAFCLVAGSVFEPTRSNEIISSVASRVENMLSQEWQNPWNTANNIIGNLSASRQDQLTNALKNYSAFGLSNTARQSVQLSANISEARLFVNDLPVPTNRLSGYLFPPVTLRATAPAGYKFLGWVNTGDTESKQTVTLISRNSAWNYYDRGSLDGIDWRTAIDPSWEEGNAPLGYFTTDLSNNRGYQTFLDYGGSTSNKYPTYYFTRTLHLSTAPAADDEFTLNWTADDGFVIYVNGTEAGRYLMPSGTPSFSTFATTYAHDNPDSGTMTLPAKLFKRGDNVIAVEVHNNSANSTDIYWDAALLQTMTEASELDIVSTDETYTMPTSAQVNLQACYIPVDDTDTELAIEATYPVRINEVSAANSVYVNDLFKKNDWVELYNTTDNDIDVAGMYLSDNLNKPQKFQIPEASLVEADYSTIIPPHGYLVVWCDKLDPLTQLHASFKLAAEGGSILLTAEDGAWCDTLTYVAHNGDQSVGLYPDGGTQLYVMTHPTIGATNMINSSTLPFEEEHADPIPTALADLHLPTNGGMTLTYDGEHLLLRTEDADNVSVEIYTTSGQRIQRLSLSVAHSATISTAQLPGGIYVARVRSTDGESCVIKFRK